MMNSELGFNQIQEKIHRNYKFASDVLNVKKAWKKTKGEGVKIMLIDTGIDKDHPDLSQAFVEGMDMFAKTREVYDDAGHGTAVAGLIVGQKTGIAPNAELYTAKVLDKDGHGSMTSVLDGITYAINLNVDILCMSLGIKNGIPTMLEERINRAEEKGITVVCATGNEGLVYVDYPAKLDNVIGAGSVDKDLKHSYFSNFSEGLDFVAPAENISTTFLNGQYSKVTGTSFSSPLITGCIALMISYARSLNVQLTPRQIKEILIKTSSNGYWDRATGWGVPNVEEAFKKIKEGI